MTKSFEPAKSFWHPHQRKYISMEPNFVHSEDAGRNRTNPCRSMPPDFDFYFGFAINWFVLRQMYVKSS